MHSLNFVGFCHCGSVIKNDLCLQVLSLACLQYICFHGWTVQGCFYALLFVRVTSVMRIFDLTTVHLNILKCTLFPVEHIYLCCAALHDIRTCEPTAPYGSMQSGNYE